MKMDLPEGRERLERMRAHRQKQLGNLGPVMAGNLARRKTQSGYYLTDKVQGKTRTMHVSEQMHEQVTAWSENYRRAKRLLGELSEIQRALLKAEKD